MFEPVLMYRLFVRCMVTDNSLYLDADVCSLLFALFIKVGA